MPRLIDDWKGVLKRAWSVRLNAAVAALTGLFIAWPTVLTDAWDMLPDSARAVLPENVALAAPLILSLAGMIARIMVQPDGE